MSNATHTPTLTSVDLGAVMFRLKLRGTTSPTMAHAFGLKPTQVAGYLANYVRRTNKLSKKAVSKNSATATK